MDTSFGKKIILFVFAIGLLALVYLSAFSGKVRNLFYLVSKPSQCFFSDLGKKTSNFLKNFSNVRILETEKEKLLLENRELKSQLSSLVELRKENESLRMALGAGLPEGFVLLPCSVTSGNLFEGYGLIDKGSKDGLEEGMPVITAQKTLLAMVGEVYDNFSRINLISGKGSSFPGKLQTEDITGGEVIGVVKGDGSLNLFFDLIPQGVKVEKGQRVVTSNLGGTLPNGIFVGEIESIEVSDLNPYQKAKIKPGFDFRELEIVFLILDY